MAKGDGGAWDIAAREKPEGTFFSLGTERKSALLRQLHDGLAIFVPATGGVQEPRFACVGREGPSASRAACSWGACEGGRLDRWLMR